ncbi:nucleoporin NUP188 isoform X2 [Spea bombifrons]|uniref:nucleoporin NUP188 isoform X2 n=1 Tax=Spea bombifrons TaxID=233779 RepID=UPI00234A9CB0|nr:nucleoporin NUP188 isoform X2 [Spea bombifrons]
MAQADTEMDPNGLHMRSCRELWTILLGRSALRDPTQIKAELDRFGDRFLQGLAYYKPPSPSSANKVKLNKSVHPTLKELGLRISKFLGLDEEQSVQLLLCYLQDDYRGTQASIKLALQEERQSQALMLKIANYYYEERICMLRCVLQLLTYFQDEKHPYRMQFAQCMEMLEQKDMVGKYCKHLEKLCKEDAPTWETHGNLMTERQVSRWFVQCLREQAMLLEVIFLYYAYFAISPKELLSLTRLFKEQGFGLRQQNRHLIEASMDPLVERIGYFAVLILLEGFDIDTLQECALKDHTDQHPFALEKQICKDMDDVLLMLGDLPHHAPVLLAWALLRHTLSPDEAAPAIRKMGNTAIKLHVFQYLTNMLRALGSGENNCTTSTACVCVYSLLCFVLMSLEEQTLGNQQDVIDTACQVLSAPNLSDLFWNTEPTTGLGILLDSVCGMFPYHMSPLLQLLTPLVSNRTTARKVYMFLNKMSFYTEYYKHKPHDVLSHEDETLWKRQSPKLLYALGLGQTNIRVPQGTIGQVTSCGLGALVRWEFSYSCWTLFTCEIEMVLHVVSTADVIQHCERVKPIIDLVHKVISADPSLADCLLPITSRLYLLLQRLTTIMRPPMTFIASCVNCVTALAQTMTSKVWADLHQTGFLPLVSNPGFGRISAEGMNSGGYRTLLGIEQMHGEYDVTISFLHLVTALVKGRLGSTQGLIPSIQFVLHEILPNYYRWRYKSHGVRDQLGYLILQLLHAILNLSSDLVADTSNPSLQSVCVYGLLNTEARQAVINVMGTGVDTINGAIFSRAGSSGTEGQGQMLIQMVKLAFSITNNVIRLKPPSSGMSLLEQALTQHGADGNNLIAVLAKYIYHKYDPSLPRLAIQLLKRLATVAPMSVYACLGSDAAAIRDAFLNRLQCTVEDMQIKVMILDLLTVAVETQPGLIELFLNLQVKDASDGTKEYSMGRWSCLHVVLDLIDFQQPDRFWCTPQLHRSAVAFLHALWQDRRDSAMTVLRTKPHFWEKLTSPLFGTLLPLSESSELSALETCAFIMKILCLEIFYVVRGSLDSSLKSILKKFSDEKRFAYWSKYVHSLICQVADEEGSRAIPPEYQMLLSGWRMLLIVSTNHAEVTHLTDAAVRKQLFRDILDGTQALFQVQNSVVCLQLGSMLCTLMVILLRKWMNDLDSPSDIILCLAKILEGILQTDPQQMEKTKSRVFSALISVVNMKPMKASEIPQYQQLVHSVCETLQDEVLSLVDQTQHSLKAESNSEDSMETESSLRTRQKDQRDGVCVLALYLAKELCQADEDGEQWLLVIRKLPVLHTLLGALEVSLRFKQNLHFCDATLHLLFTLAKTHQGAAAVAGAGLAESVCLPLLSVYQLSTNGASTAQPSISSRKALDAPSWPGVYRLTVSLMERLLKTLRYNFLTEALDFVGVHQERILQCLGAVRTVQSLACLEEADHTVGFLLQLSSFTHEWHFHLPQLMKDIQVNLCYLCQSCTSLLHSRKMLQHYLQIKNGETVAPAAAPRGSQTPSKQPTAESEALEFRALQCVQHSLLKILSQTLASLRAFTPDLCQILQLWPLDLAQYQLLFSLSFTTPAFDTDVTPSFGTLLATVNVTLNMLGELDKKKDLPLLAQTLPTTAEENKNLKSLLLFTMENCFYVLISQAVRYLKDSSVNSRDKQRMKQELSSELSTLLSSISRYLRRGGPSSPAGGLLPSPQSQPATFAKAAPEAQDPIIQLVHAFVRQLQR